MHAETSGRRPSGAFTLIELLVVIGIIGILVAIGLSIGGRVANSGKASATRDLINRMESTLTEYISVEQHIPPPWVADPRPGNTNQTWIQPVADARHGGDPDSEMINSVGLFMLQGKGIPSVEAIFKTLDTKFLREYSYSNSTPTTDPGDHTQPQPLRTVVDAFGRPLAYVHPAFDGLIYGPNYATPSDPASAVSTQDVAGLAPTGHSWGIDTLRRNATTSPTQTADGDGGICVGGHPYFYSAGPDGDPSTIDDNVYVTKPTFQKN